MEVVWTEGQSGVASDKGDGYQQPVPHTTGNREEQEQQDQGIRTGAYRRHQGVDLDDGSHYSGGRGNSLWKTTTATQDESLPKQTTVSNTDKRLPNRIRLSPSDLPSLRRGPSHGEYDPHWPCCAIPACESILLFTSTGKEYGLLTGSSCIAYFEFDNTARTPSQSTLLFLLGDP